MALHVREQLAGQGQGVQHRGVVFDTQPPQLRLQKRSVEGGVVSRDGAAADEVHQLGNGYLGGGLVGQHHVGNAGDLGDFRRQGPLGIHQQGQAVRHRAAHQLHRADLDHPVRGGVQARGLKVQDNDRIVQGTVVRVLDHVLVVNEVPLAAGDQLDGLLLHRVEGRGEGLHHAVVGDGHRRMPPLDGPLDQVAGGGHGVHVGHVGVHVQLDALFLGGVLPLDALHGHHVPHGYGQLTGKVVIHALAAHLDVHAHFDLLHLLHHGAALLLGDGGRRGLVVPAAAEASALAEAQEGLAQDGGGIVRDGKGHQQHFAALELLGFQLEDIALHHHQAAVAGQLLHFHGAVGDAPAHDGLADGGVGHLREDGLRLLFRLRLLLGARRGGLALLLLLWRGRSGSGAVPVAGLQLLLGDGG